MIRISTRFRDRSILRIFKAGKSPKEIAQRMALTSVWVVYNALRRERAKLSKTFLD